MDLGLTGKIAMVAGASKGLGYATAKALAAEGAIVSIGSRDKAAIEKAAADIGRETGGVVMPFEADVRSGAAINAWASAVEKSHGGIDLLYANAGGPPAGSALDFHDEDWQQAFELLLLSTIRMCRAVVPSMRRRGGGSRPAPRHRRHPRPGAGTRVRRRRPGRAARVRRALAA